MPERNGLVYEDKLGGWLRLFIFGFDGYHSAGILFGRDVTFPDLTIAAARRTVEAAMADGREVRITNGGDFLVFHAKDNKLIYPADAAAFWREVEGQHAPGGR